MAINNLTLRQLNCGKRIASTTEILSWHSHINIIQEPNFGQIKQLGTKFNVYTQPKSRSLICTNKNIDATLVPKFSNKDITTIQLEKSNIYICSAYLDIKAMAWPTTLYNLAAYCQTKNINLIIGADSNAHSTLWNCPASNARGESIEQAIIRHNLHVENVGNKFTFEGGVGSSIIDITLTNRQGLISGWNVSDDATLSDHKIIEFSLNSELQLAESLNRKLKNLDWRKIASVLDGKVPTDIPHSWTPEVLDDHVNQLTGNLKEILDTVAPLKPPAKRFNYWWNDDCARLKTESRRAEKQRRAHPTPAMKARERNKRKEYTEMIHKSKKQSWRKFIAEIASTQEASRVNKILRKSGAAAPQLGLVTKADGELSANKQETLDEMLREHFPGSRPWMAEDTPNTAYDNEGLPKWLSVARFKAAVKQFKSGKTPGPDEFRSECLTKLNENTIKYILRLYHASVKMHYVPQTWRDVKVIFLAKPGKPDYTSRRAFRPISLMFVLFKTLERLVLWKIEEENLSHHPMHRLQFGFKKGCSTEQALSKAVNIIEKGVHQGQYVLGVFCDIAGAFDNVKLESITNMMADRGIDEDIIHWYEHFLRERKVSSTLGTSQASVKPGKGTPQGGVLSAIISWNLIFDDLLKKYDGKAIISIGFADDGTLLITGPVASVLYNIMQEALNTATAWAEKHGLRFCPKKTNSVLFTRKQGKIQHDPLTMYGNEIPEVRQVKLLGVTLDDRLSWLPHIEDKIKVCKGALMQLLPVMRRTWSPKPEYTKWLYKDVVLPIILYGCHLWAHKISSTAIINRLNKLQRLGLLSVTHVRKSTPTAALELLYDIPPIHLQVKERAQNTLPRLRNLLREGDWLSKDGVKNGHLSLLKLDSTLVDDGTLRPPQPNFDKNYTVYITQEPRFEGGFKAYTDGSLIEGNSGAGAFLRYNDDEIGTISERLPNCTVFQAELRAIRAACERLHPMLRRDETINFYVDSQAALKAISAPYVYDNEVLLTVEALNRLAANEHRVVLQWVKAHVGLYGNELADRAAKEGAFSERWHHGSVLELPLTQKQINKQTLREEWKHLWKQRKDCRQSKFFLPHPDEHVWKNLRHCSTSELSQLARFFTGHTFMRRHNTLVTKGRRALDEEGNCSLCEEEEETPIHLLNECPVLNVQRATLLLAWQLDTPPPISDDLFAFVRLDAIRELESDTTTASID